MENNLIQKKYYIDKPNKTLREYFFAFCEEQGIKFRTGDPDSDSVIPFLIAKKFISNEANTNDLKELKKEIREREMILIRNEKKTDELLRNIQTNSGNAASS